MAPRVPRVPSVRPEFVAAALAVALMCNAGCKHHRSAYRPVYAPAPAVVLPEAGCATDPGPTIITEPGDNVGLPPTLPPSGATSGFPDEPRLDPAGGEVPELNAPQETRRDSRRAVPASTRRATLRSRVAAFADDPADLFQPPKADRPWRYVVLHHSAHAEGGYGQIDREHRKRLGTDGCGYHFVIGNGTDSEDGKIEVARRWSDQKGGAHCRDARAADVNDLGIGICLVGDLDDRPPTPRQIEAARALIAYLSDRYAIPPARVGTHAQVALSPTACPGKNFPATAILGDRGLASR